VKQLRAVGSPHQRWMLMFQAEGCHMAQAKSKCAGHRAILGGTWRGSVTCCWRRRTAAGSASRRPRAPRPATRHPGMAPRPRGSPAAAPGTRPASAVPSARRRTRPRRPPDPTARPAWPACGGGHNIGHHHLPLHKHSNHSTVLLRRVRRSTNPSAKYRFWMQPAKPEFRGTHEPHSFGRLPVGEPSRAASHLRVEVSFPRASGRNIGAKAGVAVRAASRASARASRDTVSGSPGRGENTSGK